MDPEPSMLQAARVAAAEAHVDIEFIEASSYDLDPQLGMFQVMTIGRAFHLDGPARRARQAGWADRAKWCSRVVQRCASGDSRKFVIQTLRRVHGRLCRHWRSHSA